MDEVAEGRPDRRQVAGRPAAVVVGHEACSMLLDDHPAQVKADETGDVL
jgi:hypothetical protein